MNADWLKKIREDQGYSQAEVAACLGMSQSQYSRFEATPDELQYRYLKTLSVFLGFDINYIEEEQHVYPAIDSGDPYRTQKEQVRALKKLVLSNAEARSVSDKTKSMSVEVPNIDDFLELVRNYEHKPNIVLAGHYDTGKSYLANQLLGGDFLPSGHQPTTKLVSIIRHLSEKPDWQREEVCFLQKDFWRNGDEYQFSLSILNDNDKYIRYCKHESTLTSLRDHGVFIHGRKRREAQILKQLEVHTAVIYIDSPMLLSCNIIDMPGFSDSNIEGLDEERLQPIRELMDILVYTSGLNGFMDARDQANLKYLLSLSCKGFENFSQHPNLGNVFVVCTLASPELIGDEELERVLESGADRLNDQIQESILRELEEKTGRTYAISDLDERFYSFWAQSRNRYKRLLESLSSYLGKILPDTYMNNFENEINEFKLKANERISKAIGYYQKVRDDVEGARIKYQSIKDYEPQRKKEINREVIQLTTLIRTLRSSSRESFSLKARRHLQIDELKNIITNKYEKQKEAKENAPLLIFSRLEAMAKEAVNEDYNKIFVSALKEFVKTYSSFTFESDVDKPGTIELPFNFRRLFIDSFVGGAAIAVGAAFGPVGLGIGVGVAAIAWIVNRLSWQERLSKQIIEKFEEKQIILTLESGIEDFWNNVETSFRSLFEQSERDWQRSISELESMIDINPMVTAEKNIQDLESLNHFFAQLQWETKS